MASLITFFKEVSAEARKVVWPSSRELYVTVLFVIFVAFIAGLVFFLVDSALYRIVKLFLNFGS
ncbi:preprotein translocase subunit SecE [Candidatus Lariskella endosymbiont of Epinotia ramella]|uniref:preprotein translocase subunit SecE n=1 Tax=unclassified Candidatus Lariskella TaxID=2632605 RepID=UPI0039777E8E